MLAWTDIRSLMSGFGRLADWDLNHHVECAAAIAVPSRSRGKAAMPVQRCLAPVELLIELDAAALRPLGDHQALWWNTLHRTQQAE